MTCRFPATIAPSPLPGVSPFLLSAKVRTGSAAMPRGDLIRHRRASRKPGRIAEVSLRASPQNPHEPASAAAIPTKTHGRNGITRHKTARLKRRRSLSWIMEYPARYRDLLATSSNFHPL